MVWDQNRLQNWLAGTLRFAVQRYGIIFVGYSASDRDIVEALRPALESSVRREAWVASLWDGTAPTEIVELLKVFGTPSNALPVGFDDFMEQLSEAIDNRAASLKTEDQHRAPARHLHSRVYRLVRLQAPSIPDSPLPIEGPWHPLRERVLHATLDPETAFEEVFAQVRPDVVRSSSFDLVELEVQLHKVLDLLDPRTHVAMQIEAPMLDDQHLSRGIATRARDAGMEALIVPSRYSPSGKLLVVFLDALLPNSRVAELRRRRVNIG